MSEEDKARIARLEDSMSALANAVVQVSASTVQIEHTVMNLIQRMDKMEATLKNLPEAVRQKIGFQPAGSEAT